MFYADLRCEFVAVCMLVVELCWVGCFGLSYFVDVLGVGSLVGGFVVWC